MTRAPLPRRVDGAMGKKLAAPALRLGMRSERPTMDSDARWPGGAKRCQAVTLPSEARGYCFELVRSVQ